MANQKDVIRVSELVEEICSFAGILEEHSLRQAKGIQELEARLEGMVPRGGYEKINDMAARYCGQVKILEEQLAEARAQIARLEEEKDV